MSDWKYHCDVLSVPENASPQEIKTAFRKLALKHHPDRNGGTAQSKERFQRLNISYKYLMRNLVSRPRPEPPKPPHHHTPPPPPPHHRREEFKRLRKPGAPPETWASWLGRFLSSKPPQFPWHKLHAYWQENRAAFFRIMPVGAGLLATMISMFTLLKHNTNEIGQLERVPASMPAPVPASTPVDERGRPSATCLMQALDHDALKDESRLETSESDCDLRCLPWNDQHPANHITCTWKTTVIRNRPAPGESVSSSMMAPGAAIAAALKEVPRALHPHIRDDGLFEDPRGMAEILYVGDGNSLEFPDSEQVPEERSVKIGDHPEIAAVVSPRIWISDRRLMQAEPGPGKRGATLTPIRRGEVVVLITDKTNQPIQKFLYTIH